jgi:protocatechuate 3,4-dioxygenase beta subunit
LAKTPACDDGHTTPPQTEGPYFKPSSPERIDIRDGAAGDPLRLTGRVLSPECEPHPAALLDFWQADGNGVYDNEGFRLRGHQLTDRDGRFELATVVPGEYPGRTRHIHVMVQPEGGELLTTQLYFPDSPGNETDPLFNSALLIDEGRSGGEPRGSFDFVV